MGFVTAMWRRRVERNRLMSRADELQRMFEQIEHLDPCPTPDCMHFRQLMLDYAKNDTPSK